MTRDDGHATDEVEADEALADVDISHHFTGLVERELGPEAARTLGKAWHAQEVYEERRRPGEGLRERKKRITRQRISDVATTLFVARGFDAVTVAEVAEQVGISEKTVYNYFPTKESLVFDQAEQQLADYTTAIRDRGPGISPSAAMVATVKDDTERLEMVTRGSNLDFLIGFGDMVRESAALRAAWAEQRADMVEALRGILADEAGVDPRDPEPVAVARALVSIQEVFYESYLRHVQDRLSPSQIRAAVDADVDRTARLVDTGLWSFHLMVEGRRTKQQILEAAASAEHSRKQVMAAIRQAKRAWHDLRSEQRDVGRELRERGREIRDEQREMGRELRERGRELRDEARRGR